MYQPNYSGWGRREALEGRLERYFHIKPKRDEPVKYRLDYEKIWENILDATNHANRKNEFYGAIVGFDDTPRRGKNVFEIQDDQVYLRTFSDVENNIDLFTKRYTKSEVTGYEYDTSVKVLTSDKNMQLEKKTL